ncbi:hypothetical protein BDV24DRAFT_121821, partial [Aspergillus arachidicola]
MSIENVNGLLVASSSGTYVQRYHAVLGDQTPELSDTYSLWRAVFPLASYECYVIYGSVAALLSSSSVILVVLTESKVFENQDSFFRCL